MAILTTVCLNYAVSCWKFRHMFAYSGLPIMRSFLNYGDFNFFMVDWSIGAETLNYIVARGRVNEGIVNATDGNLEQMFITFN